MRVVLMAAVGRNGVIGAAGGLPWKQASDLARFRTLTWGRPVLMGRRTFESIGRPLAGRTSVVVTRGGGMGGPGVVYVGSIAEGMERAAADARRRGSVEIVVAGGSEIFAATIGLVDRLEITEIDASPEGDAKFPAIDSQIWFEAARRRCEAGGRDQFAFEYVTYLRR